MMKNNNRPRSSLQDADAFEIADFRAYYCQQRR